MRKVLAVLLLLLSATPLVAAPSKPKLDELNRAVSAALAKSTMPGIVVGITDRDKLLQVYVHGYADVKTRAPLTADSRFAIGSISKSFTSIALMQMADEGRFDPKAPLTKYLPSLEILSAFPAMTGRDVLSHTAGLPNYLTDAASSRFVIAALKDFVPAYAPGAHWHYSNTGYQLLGYVLEDFEKRPYPQIIRDRVFAATGMSHSSAIIDDAERQRMTISYTHWSYDNSVVEAPWYEYTAGDGSIVSTAGDMCAYARLLLNGGVVGNRRILSERAFTELTTPILEDYAYGLWVRHQDGHSVISHSGGIAGFSSYLEAHADEGFAIVFLSNGGIDPEFQDWLIKAVAASVAGRPLPAAPAVRHPLVTATMGNYAGTYYEASTKAASARGAKVEVKLVNEKLMLVDSRAMHALQRIGPDLFRVADAEGDTSAYLFSRADEKPDSPVVQVSHGATSYVTENFDTKSMAVTATANPSAIVGHYAYSGPEGPVARVFIRSGSPIAAFLIDDHLYTMPLAALGSGEFRLGDSPQSPERARFDTLIGGRAMRLTLSGVPLYRRDTP